MKTGPTQVTLYCDAKIKQKEYCGRPLIIDGVDHSNKPNKPVIPPVPFSLSASTNRLLEESFAMNKAERK
jgi:hypothetical protein